jgi:hypothetical protein
VEVHAGKAFGSESDNDSGRVKKPGVVGVSVDDGKAPEGLGNFGPEDNGNVSAALEKTASMVMVSRGSGEREVIVLWPRSRSEKSLHAADVLGVVKELREGLQDVGMKVLPRKVA